MTQLSGFWTTNSGTSATGHQQASYTQAQWSTAAKILSACSGFEGVAPNYLNALAPSTTGANNCRIATGGAMVDGKWYNNDANVDVSIPSAVGGGNTRIDRVVLRADWAASGFDVTVFRIAGTDAASPTAPAITQTSGTTYDIMLCQALVDTGGTVTITDERTVASPRAYRQGGSATNWDTTGTTNYPTAQGKVYRGVRTWTGSADTSGSVTVTLPTAYTYDPITLAQSETSGVVVNAYCDGTTLTLTWIDAVGITHTSVVIHWQTEGI